MHEDNDDGDSSFAVDSDGWACNDPDWGPYRLREPDGGAKNYWSDSSEDRKMGASKKKVSRKSVPGRKLYAIARGRGGPAATGLYRETWDTIDFIVTGFSKARYKRVQSKKEGVAFLKGYYRAKGLGRPQCFKEG